MSTRGSEAGWPGSSSWGGITWVLEDGAGSAPEKKSSSFSATAETAYPLFSKISKVAVRPNRLSLDNLRLKESWVDLAKAGVTVRRADEEAERRGRMDPRARGALESCLGSIGRRCEGEKRTVGKDEKYQWQEIPYLRGLCDEKFWKRRYEAPYYVLP